MSTQRMQIEIFSDLVCPWCYIGKRRLDATLAERGADDLEVVWRAFQLYPQMPAAGMPREEFLTRRFGGAVDTTEIYRRVSEEAAAAGLDLDFAGIKRAPNTFLGHRLLSWAESSGRQHELAEQLFHAYFVEGRDIGDAGVLAAIAGAAGLDADAAAAMLAGDAQAAQVEEELALAEAVGVTGVPFFVLAGRFAIPGAQPVDVMAQFIDRARERLATSA